MQFRQVWLAVARRFKAAPAIDSFETKNERGEPMKDQNGGNPRISRRDFIKVTGAIVVVAGIGG
jgi:hypothetical protein